MKLYRVDEEQLVSISPLMLKKGALRLYEHQPKRKALLKPSNFSLVHLCKHEYSTKERKTSYGSNGTLKNGPI